MFFALVWTIALAISLDFHDPHFRPWDLLSQDDSLTFRGLARIEMTEIGDLGYRNWVPELQFPRPTIFTTDRWGFRNPPDIERARVMITGNSFVVGTGLSDSDTISARLTAALGEPVYNYGLQLTRGIPQILLDPRFQQNPPKILILAPNARSLAPLAMPDEVSARSPQRPRGELSARWSALVAPLRQGEDAMTRFREGLDRDNNLTVQSKLLVHQTWYRLFGLEDLIWVDGGPALVLSLKEQRFFESPEELKLDETAEHIARFRDLLAKWGTTLVFCPIPETADVYLDLFPLEQRRRVSATSPLDRFMAAVEKTQVVTIDLRPAYTRNREPYLFLRDDTHWSPRGVEIAAREIAQQLKDRQLLP